MFKFDTRFFNKNLGSSQRYTAFTLAEILIVLGIIGIVAEMTIPTLINGIYKKDTVVKLKKSYSILAQATEQISNDCGGNLMYCLTNPDSADNDATTRQELTNLYKAKLSIVKDCTDGVTTKCFADTTYKLLQGNPWINYDTHFAYDRSRFILSDGVAVSIDWNGARNFFVMLDINGIKKPNWVGKDLFYLYYDPTTTKATLKPGDANDCSLSGNGTGCAAKIIQEDAITFY